ncbi:U4/U6 small nuclear ribonucleoprotein Prp31-like [Sycon ciliatum]|uniref:U4/U6 small nuclear ribonucleoprotein Prp31-like n=1 Tax=Sycon ciliatum TaxID=27933 RepID=UPI0020AEA352|eukprot:scpid52636/ scgid21500/ U4/U6 small nuclear ribonucleoprotein Prp31; Pre-mRNA-processing factor 31
MSLADELLADFEELGDDGEDDAQKQDAEEEEEQLEEMMMMGGKLNIKQIAKLHGSEQLTRVLQEISKYAGQERTDPVVGPVEQDPEYMIIVEANNIAAEIDNEIAVVHKYVIDEYSKRFPELQSLVVAPLEYVMTVKRLLNDLEVTKSELAEVLPPATIMVVSVTASTTQGKRLPADDIRRVEEACDMVLELNEAKLTIYQYVEGRMSFIAPNITMIVGAPAAAKLMGIAGGLTALAKIPACNIMVLGAARRLLSGFSSAQVQPHTGLLFYCDIVQGVPPDYRRKAVHLVSSKCALAARVDSFHECMDGSKGQQFREEIEEKLAKLQEPAPPKQQKALPRPDDGVRKKRGGRRVRSMKAKLAVSDMRKQANRMTFAEINEDAYQEDLGVHTGNLGKGGTGKLRAPVNDKKTKVTMSKRLQREVQRQQTSGGRTSIRGAVSGTASSVAFTPLQGLEIVNPQAAETTAPSSSNKYFGAGGGFSRVKPGAS